ncbi:hypothetical protein BD410DRAFT_809931 [Rickenella mellea]|uniref:Uncharacterized protein n=1 Tax=Rickenella mellea TaxID=50990 RepID=A0A4Y7PI16_9AGAM|nr:hypothetical protein BD410DRAFT_809931 [Rickenella mellea]
MQKNLGVLKHLKFWSKSHLTHIAKIKAYDSFYLPHTSLLMYQGDMGNYSFAPDDASNSKLPTDHFRDEVVIRYQSEVEWVQVVRVVSVNVTQSDETSTLKLVIHPQIEYCDFNVDYEIWSVGDSGFVILGKWSVGSFEFDAASGAKL